MLLGPSSSAFPSCPGYLATLAMTVDKQNLKPGARELPGGKIASLDRVKPRTGYFDFRKIFVYATKRPSLVWTNSARMKQPYLPLAVALPA